MQGIGATSFLRARVRSSFEPPKGAHAQVRAQHVHRGRRIRLLRPRLGEPPQGPARIPRLDAPEQHGRLEGVEAEDGREAEGRGGTKLKFTAADLRASAGVEEDSDRELLQTLFDDAEDAWLAWFEVRGLVFSPRAAHRELRAVQR